MRKYFTRQALKDGFTILKAAFNGFMNDMALKYSASLSYYTIFSLAPMLIIIITFCGFLFSKEAMQGEIYGQIKNLVGSDAALQIHTTPSGGSNSSHRHSAAQDARRTSAAAETVSV